MDVKLRQRIVGAIVLASLLMFCVFLLLKGEKKPQPHIPPINVEPPVSLAQLPAPSAKQAETKAQEPASVSVPPLPASVTTTSMEMPTVDQTQNKAGAESKTQALLPQSSAVSGKKDNIAVKMPFVSAQASPQKTVNAVSSTAKPVKKAAKIESTKTREPKRASSSAASGPLYIVQAGAFRDANHVKSLTEKLRREEFIVSTYKIKTTHGELTVVSIGGKGVEKERALHFRALLEKKYQLKPIVKRAG